MGAPVHHNSWRAPLSVLLFSLHSRHQLTAARLLSAPPGQALSRLPTIAGLAVRSQHVTRLGMDTLLDDVALQRHRLMQQHLEAEAALQGHLDQVTAAHSKVDSILGLATQQETGGCTVLTLDAAHSLGCRRLKQANMLTPAQQPKRLL